VISIIVENQVLVPMTEASQNFLKVARIADERGMVVILKNSKPQYMPMNFSEYEEIQELRHRLVNAAIDMVIAENLSALRELAK
jgi:antitoxin Phd